MEGHSKFVPLQLMLYGIMKVTASPAAVCKGVDKTNHPRYAEHAFSLLQKAVLT